MGIFGRDERTPESKPSAPQPERRQPAAGSQTAAGSTVIAATNSLEGTILGAGDVRVEGMIKGTVDTGGHLLVADKGGVEGTIKARSVTVAGKVTGDITGAEKIELNPSSKVEGNITAPRILINDGATFDGKVYMKDPGGGKAGGSKESTNIATSTARRKDEPAGDEAKTDEKKS